jgi:alpha-beta hydrolase superfamily lysophospholipase
VPIFLNELSTDKRTVEKKGHDGRRYSGDIMNRTYHECLKLSHLARLQIPNLTLPFLIMHGELDQISLVSGADYLFENSGTDDNHKTKIILKSSMHHPIHEVPRISKQCLKKIQPHIRK